MSAGGEFGVGARLPRLEDARFLEGRGQFCADIVLPGMLHAAFVRSPHAHARIVTVRKPQGYEKRVFCAGDLRGVGRMRSTAKLPGFKPSDWPILAANKVRHVGEPIAMAVAATAAEAEDLAALVAVDFEPLPPVVTVADALKRTPPFVHDEWGDNVLVDIKLEAGDLNAAKSAAVHVIERSFRMNRMHPLPLEGRACVAAYDSRLNELVVYVAHQLPVPLQIGLAQVLGISQRRLRVVVPDVGASFGLKTYVESETVCVAFAAMQLRRPVRWIQDRHESLICDATCRDYQCKITGYADANGRVLALDCDVVVDSGAYSPWPWPAGIEGGLAVGNMQGCYDIRAFRGRAINVVSNKPAGQPFRGVARPLSCIGHEIVMDGIAQAAGIDPLEVRLRNFVKPEQMPYVSITKKTLDSGDYAAALKRAAELVDMPAVRARQKKAEMDGRLIGIGFASFYEQTAYGTGPFGYSAWGIELVPGMEPAVARLTGDGELVLEVGSHSHGQGHETAFAQVAHEVLGIDPRKVSVRFGDTSVSTAGTGTYTSRSMVTTGGAIAEACRLLMKPIAKIGAHLLQCREDDVRVEDGRVRGPQGSVEFSEIGRAWYHHPEDLPADVDPGGLTATAGYKPHDPGVFSYSAHAAVVAVDPETGAIELLDYAIVADCGTRVNPLLVEGQILGGFSNGLGNALYEESSYDSSGQPTATTLADYTAPTAPSIPEVKLDFIETPSPFSVFGMKGIGENGAIGPPAAIVNAVNDALRPLGVAVFETPVTASRVRAAIARASTSG
ncbi:MAG TPA: xanthine dehydrogenase family protein molybdopterin-binding subunit [Xanthobacteraceae bacterium]|nr:xanthine dehydrogenase family protein molybdopterin-binding subunit [Xanthobacteraceae bacterium]